MEDHLTYEERLKQQQVAAKAAILAQCDRLATAGITFVAVHFDGSGDDGVTEDIKCYDSDVYAYEEWTTSKCWCRTVTKMMPVGSEMWSWTCVNAKSSLSGMTASRTTQRRLTRSSYGSSAEACAE